MIIENLKGRRFTRTKYGKQSWVKVIDKVLYEAQFTDNQYNTVRVIIISDDGSQYYLDEIGLV
jgi:hypothetical protein